MSKFLFSRKAVNDLDEIWDYTVKIWSEKQAETYYLLLIESCNELAKNPAKGKNYDIVEKDILGCKTGQHIIFYRKISENEIEIIRILHGMMDLKSKF